MNLWTPAKSLNGHRKVRRAEVAEHTTFEDCWIVIRNKVYDFTEWKDHPMAHFCMGDLVDH
jgi:cytochrome b involved in lipid metabolism